MRHWLVVDTSFCCHHKFHSTAMRDPVASVLLAVLDVESYVNQFNPTGIVWAFDSRPYLRSADYPGYKVKPAKNDDDAEQQLELKRQITKLCQEYLPHLGYKNNYQFKGYEADDVIASVVLSSPAQDRFTIISRDHDLYQLLSPRVSLYDPVQRSVMTSKSFREEYGMHPSEWPEVKAIAGCRSDRIPGAVGVADPTAIQYVQGNSVKGVRGKKIREFITTPDYQRNLKLVTLPYPGMPGLTPISSPCRHHVDTWATLIDKLDMPGLASLDTKRWRVGCG